MPINWEKLTETVWKQIEEYKDQETSMATEKRNELKGNKWTW